MPKTVLKAFGYLQATIVDAVIVVRVRVHLLSTSLKDQAGEHDLTAGHCPGSSPGHSFAGIGVLGTRGQGLGTRGRFSS